MKTPFLTNGANDWLVWTELANALILSKKATKFYLTNKELVKQWILFLIMLYENCLYLKESFYSYGRFVITLFHATMFLVKEM